MSGNKFSCGMRRFDKHNSDMNNSDKPSNQQLHMENQKRLNDLIRQREEQDSRVFQAIDIKPVSFQKVDNNYTAWKTPN